MKKDFKYIIKRILIGVGIILVMSFINSCDVHALTVDDMSYGSKVYFLDFRGGQWGKNYNIVSPDFGTEYMVYYKTMTSATYGIGAGVYLEQALLPSNTYRVTYLWAVPNGGCSIYDWNQFGVLNNLSDSGQQNLSSRQVPSIDQGLLEFDENITLNVCVYSVTFVPDKIGSALVLPMKSGNSTTEAFVFWGFVLEDAGNGLVLQSTINDNFSSIRTQNQTIINQNQQIINSQNETNDLIKDDNVSGAESQVNDLLNNSSFQDNSGIQSIITAPLNFIRGLTNTCSPISLTIPFINSNVTIPCMKQELTNRVPTIVPILSTIINGFIIYRILLDIVAIVKSAREPDEDRIEVLDL